MAGEQTGIFFINVAALPNGSFPREFRKGALSGFEPRFVGILVACAVVFFGVFAVLSIRKPATEVSDKEISRIQERYARLVLNQPKPVEEKVTETAAAEKTGAKTEAEEKKEEVKVDREKETFTEKQKRREASSEERRQKRAEVARQLQSSGIFAAITAAGGSGAGVGASASDLLGSASDGLSDLGSINVSKGTFASKNVDAAELTRRKGERVTGVGIEKQAVGRAAVAQVASAASVNITSAPEVTGESASHADRSQSAIQRVVSREAQRLKRVYEDWLKRDPQLSGRLTIKFVILPSGAVSNVAIVKSSTNNPDFDDAILRYIKRWQFPPVPGGTPVEVVYPFVFEGQA